MKFEDNGYIRFHLFIKGTTAYKLSAFLMKQWQEHKTTQKLEGWPPCGPCKANLQTRTQHLYPPLVGCCFHLVVLGQRWEDECLTSLILGPIWDELVSKLNVEGAWRRRRKDMEWEKDQRRKGRGAHVLFLPTALQPFSELKRVCVMT